MSNAKCQMPNSNVTLTIKLITLGYKVQLYPSIPIWGWAYGDFFMIDKESTTVRGVRGNACLLYTSRCV